MSLIYNAFGLALKDLVGLLCKLYSTQKAYNNSNNQTER